MLKQLTLINIKSYFKKTVTNGAKKKFRMPGWLTVILVGLLLCASFFTMFYEFAQAFYQSALGWNYFAILGSMTFVFLLMTNAAMAEGQLFESKYNDMLMSMPIKTHEILLSRLISMLAYNYMMQATMLIPGLIAWIMTAKKLGAYFFNTLLLSIFWPFLPLALGAGIGFLLYKLTAKSRHKNLIKMLMTIAFIAGYYYITFSMEMAMAEGGDLSPINNVLSKIKLTEWYGKGIMHSNVKYMLYVIGLSVAAMIVMYVLLNRYFISSVTNPGVVVAKKEYKEKPVKVHSTMTALWLREFKRIGAYYTYMMNNILGVIMTVAAAVFLVIKGPSLLAELNGIAQIGKDLLDELIGGLAIMSACFMCCTYAPSSSSISLEGQSFDHLKSLPLDTKEIINSKILFHYSLMAPAQLLLSAVVCIILKPGLLVLLAVVLVPQLFLLASDMLGMLANLIYPKMNWTSDAEVVKRSIAATIGMLGSMALTGLAVAGYFAIFSDFMEMDVYFLAAGGVLLLMAGILYLVIMTYGVRKFERIGG